MTGIDWNVELRKIEREYDGLPPEASESELRAKRLAERLEREERDQRTATIGAWARLVLVVAMAAALPWWPYAHDCGAGLYGYLAIGFVMTCGALWVVTATWRHRLALPHSLGIMLLVAALGFSAAQVLPRLGYVSISGVQASGWRCPAR